MAVLIVGEERTLKDLHPRLFARAPSAKRLRLAREALERANPKVNLNRLRPGMILMIPDIPEITRRDRNIDVGTRTEIDRIGAELHGVIDETRRNSRVVLAENAKRRAQLERVVQSDSLDKLAGKDRRLVAEIKAVRTRIEERNRQDAERRRSTEQALDRWAEDLKAVQRLLPVDGAEGRRRR